jgi:hypothetical protein
MSLSNTEKNAMLDTLNGSFVSLHTGDPGTTGASEAAVTRVASGLAAASGGSKVNSATVMEFPSMPGVTVSYVGFWTLISGGTFLQGGALTSPIVVPAGATFRFALNQLSVTVS